MPRCAALLLLAFPLAAAPVPKTPSDPLPDGALLRLGSARFRGFSTDDVTFSNDGKTLYATDKNIVYRWDAETGKPLKPITFEVKDVVCSRVRDDRAFLVRRASPGESEKDCYVHIFDLASGKERGVFDPKEYIRFNGMIAGMDRVDVSANGRWFAAHSHRSAAVKVFDLSGDEPSEVTFAKFPPENVRLSADGRRMLTVGDKGSTVIDLKREETCWTNPVEIRSAAFTPDGSKLVGVPLMVTTDGKTSTRTLGRVTVWDAATGKELATPGITGGVWQPVFHSADTLYIGRSLKDGLAITRWDVKAEKEVWTVPVPFALVSPNPSKGGAVFAVSPDGKRVVVSDRYCRMALFDAATGERMDDDPASHPAEVRWVGFSADGKTMCSATDHDYREWDAKTGELKAAHSPAEVAGEHAQFAGATPELVVWSVWAAPKYQPWEVVAWDRAKSKVAWRIVPETNFVWEVRTVSESVMVRVGEKHGAVKLRVYDRDGKTAGQWDVDPSTHNTTPRGFGADKVFEFNWDKAKVKAGYVGLVGRSLKTGEPEVRYQFPYEGGYLADTLIAPSADGKYLGLACRPAGGGWMVLETATEKVIAEAENKGNRNIVAMPISADGQKVALHFWYFPVVRVVELKEGGRSWTLDSGGATASAVAFSPDGTRAIVGYRDGTALVWDVK